MADNYKDHILSIDGWRSLAINTHPMKIEQIRPQVIGDKASLEDRLVVEGKEIQLSDEEISKLISTIPLKLLNAKCFLDLTTYLWRYEFGLPYPMANSNLIWGPHTWPPVYILFKVLVCAFGRLPEQIRKQYFERLSVPDIHFETLMEFIPVIRIDKIIDAFFEFRTGVGNRNVDWFIRHPRRPILIEVKSRHYDLVQNFEKINQDSDNTIPPPDHDPHLLFRNIGEKYNSCDPETQLQGAWITIKLKQDDTRIIDAFNALDHSKIHYIILGDWEPGIKILTHRKEDQLILLDLFQENITSRFTFDTH